VLVVRVALYHPLPLIFRTPCPTHLPFSPLRIIRSGNRLWRTICVLKGTGTGFTRLHPQIRSTKCLLARDSAVGEIRRHLSPELRGIATSSEDPQSILKAIKAAYGKSSFATRYNAMQAFLVVKQESSETVAAFISRAREALRFLQSTRPPPAPLASRSSTSDPVYSLDDSDRELLISVLLQGTKYTALTTSLLAQSDLTVQQVEDALKNEEAHKTGVAAAAAAAAATPTTPAAAPASTSSRRSKKPKPICAFCGKPRHVAERCFKLEAASKKAKEEVSNDAKS
jgi:hypothetical protein